MRWATGSRRPQLTAGVEDGYMQSDTVWILCAMQGESDECVGCQKLLVSFAFPSAETGMNDGAALRRMI